GGLRAQHSEQDDHNDPVRQEEGRVARIKIEAEMLHQLRNSEVFETKQALQAAGGIATTHEIQERMRQRRRETFLQDRARMMEEQVKLRELLDGLKQKEDVLSSPRSDARREILRFLHVAMDRQERNFITCSWGCG